MLSVAEAQTLVLNAVRVATPEASVPNAHALGLVLAEDIASDIDMPPWDKAMMDGYAVRAVDLPGGRGVVTCIEEVMAGQTPRRRLSAGETTRIMTGAPIPEGTDAVIQVERTQPGADGRVSIDDSRLLEGQNILRRAKEMRAGELVLKRGTLLRPQELGILATVGYAMVKVVRRPQVAILVTGDEIVDAPNKPGPGQIRNGNGPVLVAQTERAGGLPHPLGIAGDNLADLQRMIAEGLQSDMLILSGGVSAGKLDLVPGALQALGVEPHFHKVAMKPGKPVFFGTRQNTLVFGLPGNPVSAYLCFELFVRPALRLRRGLADPGIALSSATLVEDYQYLTDRPTYHPAVIEMAQQGGRVKVTPWLGSPDLRSLTNCNCFVLFPAGDHHHCAGQMFPVLRVDDRD